MFNGLEGIPGSGKSYEAVVFHILSALKSGRKIITNLPLNVEAFGSIDPAFPALIELRIKPRPVLGTWDVTRVDDNGKGNAFELWPDGVEPLADQLKSKIFTRDGLSSFARGVPDSEELVTFGHVWDFYDTWKHDDGRGALFVIDECHNPFPLTGTDKQVVQWFKMHRHFNVDVLGMTQSFRDMNQPMARLIGMLIKVRKADILGRKDSYIRKVFSGYRGAVISTDERKYLPQMFALYKSHTQGNSVSESAASDVAPLSVKFRRFSWAFYAFTACALVYAFWPASKSAPVASAARALTVAGARPAAAGVAAPALAASGAVVPAVISEPELDPEPLREKVVHITGWLRGKGRVVYTFAVSAGGARVFDVQQTDLIAAGYQWKPLADCMGYLTFKKSVRTVTCDPPTMAVGSNSVPVVIADGSRASSVDRVPVVVQAVPKVR